MLGGGRKIGLPVCWARGNEIESKRLREKAEKQKQTTFKTRVLVGEKEINTAKQQQKPNSQTTEVVLFDKRRKNGKYIGFIFGSQWIIFSGKIKINTPADRTETSRARSVLTNGKSLTSKIGKKS